MILNCEIRPLFKILSWLTMQSGCFLILEGKFFNEDCTFSQIVLPWDQSHRLFTVVILKPPVAIWHHPISDFHPSWTHLQTDSLRTTLIGLCPRLLTTFESPSMPMSKNYHIFDGSRKEVCEFSQLTQLKYILQKANFDEFSVFNFKRLHLIIL